MTNSHNRTMGGGRNSERYAHGTSPPHSSNANNSSGNYFSNRKNYQNRGVAVTSTFFSGNSLLSSSPPRLGGGRYLNNKNNYFNNHNNTNNNHHNRTNGIQVLMGNASGVGGVGVSVTTSPTLPTNLTHFAGSKCFDAPAPTALPKPPQHWTTTSSSGATSSSVTPRFSSKSIIKTSSVVSSTKNKLFDELNSHNLKLLLNVQA